MDELGFPNNETWVEPPPITYDDIMDISTLLDSNRCILSRA